MSFRWGSAVRRRLVFAAPLAAAAVALLAPGTAAAVRGIDIGFAEPRLNSADASVRERWLDRAEAAAGQWVRVGVGWRGIASSPPADPTVSSSAGYIWAGPDAAIRDAAARGQKILITVNRAPDWAEGAGRPAGAEPGTWKPNPSDLRRFAQALGARYSGDFDDPLNPGQKLPEVSAFEAWNESNLAAFLSPQTEAGNNTSPNHYRLMLNQFYDGIHTVQPDAQVVAGSLSPIGSDGGPPGKARIGPLEFLRDMFCLGKKNLKPRSCAVKAKFDVLSHHPINADREPQAPAGKDDAGIAEMSEIVTMLRKAESVGNVVGPSRHPVWNTEFWWHSNPPKTGKKIPSLREQAAYVSEALYRNWQDKVELAMLYQLGDDESLFFQTGIYFENGKPKPSLTGFSFPLVGDRRSKKKVLIWGRAPESGKVAIQVNKAGKGGFKTIKKKMVGAGDVFKTVTKLKGKGKLRAKIGTQKSLTWKQGKK
ncbi:MAG: hypothetical protein WBC01_10565 [Solirubrobacterales bacterium]